MADTDEPRRPGAGDDPDMRAERALRRALAAQAGGVDPGPAPRVGDLLARDAGHGVPDDPRTGHRSDRRPARRWPAAVAVAAGIAVLAVASAVALRPDDAVPPAAAPTATATVTATPAPGPTADPTTEPTATPSEPSEPSGPSSPTTTNEPAGTTAIVWALREQETRDGVDLRLVPERVVLGQSVTDGESPGEAGTVDALVRAAVDHLLSSPAADPDHTNPWWWEGQGSGDRALAVTVGDTGTVVDLPAAAFDGPVGGQAAGSAIAALVRTVVSNGGTAPVTLLVDGRPDGEVWGAYVLDEPLEPSGQGLANGWILDPYEGQRLPAGTVTVSGTATAFEANVLWEVTDADGAVVADGFTMAGANGEYGPFSFDVDLAPGRYTVAVRERSMAGPDEGPDPVWEETTTIEVVQ